MIPALVILTATVVSAAPVPRTTTDTAWVGKTVLLTSYAVHGQPRHPDDDGPDGMRASARHGPRPDDGLESLSFIVRAEKGDWVRITDDTGAGVWVAKTHLVRLVDAIDFFTTKLKADPRAAESYHLRGWAYHLRGEPEKALTDLDTLLKLRPDDYRGLSHRGLVLGSLKRYEKAMKNLDDAVRTGGLFYAPCLVHRAQVLEAQGEYRRAFRDYELACQMNTGYAAAYCGQARARAYSTDPKLRDLPFAVRVAEIACELSDHADGVFLAELAALYAKTGQFEEAVKTQEKAMKDPAYARRSGQDGRERLKLYRDGKPYRSTPPQK